MLVLFETPAGIALFKCLDDGKLSSIEDIGKYFENETVANKMIKLKAFSKFENTTKALEAATQLMEGNMTDDLKSFLKKELKNSLKEKLAVADSKLGKMISKKFDIQVISDNMVMELMRGIRGQLNSLLSGVDETDLNTMALGLSHSLSRYKLKFSPDKVDTMIIQAIALLDDLDKELNTYAMRLKEWYGWHFPELTKILIDNLAYAKVIKRIGFRTNASMAILNDILPEELDAEIKEAAEVSMGTEISDEDLNNIHHLADQIISLSQYRAELYEYLRNRMLAIAPNLTTLVGELVGARLISHAGSLINLAKHPASTVQILGAEKALFRALKTKQHTPKYGLIFHASLIGQAGPKLKGKIARVLAAKSSIAVRLDALGDANDKEILSGARGAADRAKVEQRLRQLERRATAASIGSAKGKEATSKKYEFVSSKAYNPSADFAIPSGPLNEAVSSVEKAIETLKSTFSESDKKAKEPTKSENPEKKVKKTKEEKKEKNQSEKAEETQDKSEKKRKREDASAATTTAAAAALETETKKAKVEKQKKSKEEKSTKKEKDKKESSSKHASDKEGKKTKG